MVNRLHIHTLIQAAILKTYTKVKNESKYLLHFCKFDKIQNRISIWLSQRDKTKTNWSGVFTFKLIQMLNIIAKPKG